MPKGLESLSTKEYPGRLIIIGRDRTGRFDVIIYAITGRSLSSQARKLEHKGNAVWAKPTDEETLKEENRDLLLYPAILISRGIAVSNGKQTLDIKACFGKSHNPVEVLKCALYKWNYEPDPPVYTPRISGCVLPGKKAALSIIKRAEDGTSIKQFFDIPLIPGKGKLISTYAGENKTPLPPFEGMPVDIMINEEKAEDLANSVYDALEPKAHKGDFRVAVASIFAKDINAVGYDIFIINRAERM